MIKPLLIALNILFCINVYGQEKYSKKELIEDVQYFFNTIKKVHVNPYYHSDAVDSIKNQIIKSLPDSMDKDIFRKYLLIQTNNICDSHTGFESFFGNDVFSESNNFIPNVFQIFNGKLSIIHGKKLVNVDSINNISSKLILERFYKYCKADMSPIVRQRIIEKYFSLFYFSEFGNSSKFEISIRNATPEIIVLHFVNFKDLFKTKESNKDFIFYYFQKQDIAVLELNTFRKDKINDLSVFLLDAFRMIDSLGIKYLFVDNRYNNGGSDVCANELLDYLFDKDYKIIYGFSEVKDKGGEIRFGGNTWRRLKQRDYIFKGKLIVLQSVESTSAALDFSSAIKTSNRGLIIGEPTTESVYSYSESMSFNMPNTQFKFRCAQGLYSMPGSNDDVNYGVIPDLYYRFTNDKIDVKEFTELLKMSKKYYLGYFYFDYFK
jgi:hypothetical protein